MRSLRSKATLGFLVLVAYVAFVATLVAQQRATLLRDVEGLRTVHAIEESLTKVNTSAALAMLHLNEAYFGREFDSSIETVLLDVEAIQSGLKHLVDWFPASASLIERLEDDIGELRGERRRVGLVPLRDSMHVLVAELDRRTREVAARKRDLAASYRAAYDAMSLITMTAGGAGIVAFGALITVFVGRMTRDLVALKRRALAIVNGYRDEPLPVERRDEIGDLIDAVNRMQSGLREREWQLAVAREQRFHQEKMAAVGSLAAAIAHEINNPIAAIQGVAESLELQHAAWSADGATAIDAAQATTVAACRPRMIIEQAHRIATITRQLTDATTPQPAEPSLVDLNGLLRNVCGFVSYDPRFRDVALRLELDSQLPAILAVPDHMMQVVMNLLINAADAVAEAANRERRAIDVETRFDDRHVWMTVADTGNGMDDSVRAHAFEEFFTTKAHGKGSGIGLYMCQELIRHAGGTVSLHSMPGIGTTVTVQLPRRVGVPRASA